MDWSALPANVAPWVAVPASLFLLWKLAGEGIKSWKDAQAVGKVPPTPYEVLVARVAALEEKDIAKSDRIDRLDGEVLNLRSTVRRLAGVLSREVASVIHWIDGGARPPAPDDEIERIKTVIADLENSQDKE